MEIRKPKVHVMDHINGEQILLKLEKCGRTCYQSEPKGEPQKFIGNIIKRGHTSVLEHVSLSFNIITDRGVLAELTRHRIASYSVESTRYCNYTKGDKGISFIEPIEFEKGSDLFENWASSCLLCEESYNALMDLGAKPEQARSLLNNSLKVNIIFTANLRSLRNVFELRCAKPAHPHIKEVFIPLLLALKERIPVVFDDIQYDEEFFNMYLKDTYKDYVTFEQDFDGCF